MVLELCADLRPQGLTLVGWRADKGALTIVNRSRLTALVQRKHAFAATSAIRCANWELLRTEVKEQSLQTPAIAAKSLLHGPVHILCKREMGLEGWSLK